MNLGTCHACGAMLTASNATMIANYDTPHYREKKRHVHAACPARCRIVPLEESRNLETVRDALRGIEQLSGAGGGE